MAREMKFSGVDWLGDIPKDWDISRTKNFYTNKKQVAGNEADNYERLALTLNGVIKRSKEDANGLQPEAFNGYQVLRENQLVFKLIDLENVATSRVGYSPYTGIVSPAYIVLNPNKENESRYGEYFFLSMWQREVFNHMGDDGVRSSLNSSDLLNIPYPKVPDKEKGAIVSFLDRKCAEIDTVIEKTKATIEEYKKLKQSVITEAVTKGVRGDRAMKDSGVKWIGKIPAEWEIRKLFRAIDKIGDIDHYMPNSVETGIPYLMTGDLKEKISQVDFDVCKQVSLEDYETLSSKIKATKGDIIFARYATIGTVCIVDIDKDFLVSYSCLTIKPTQSLLIGNFLFYYLKSTAFFEDVKQYINSNTQANVGLDSMTKAKIVLPTLQEQEEIADFLDRKCAEIDKLIADKTHLLEEMESYKKSVIYEYVTGKKEVKNH